MAGSLLVLELEKNGLKVQICKERFQGVSVQEELAVSYSDLPEQERAEETLFRRALGFAAEKINVSQCSTAVLAVPCFNASFRHLSFPFASRKKIRQVMDLELAAQLPLNNTAYVSDFIMTDGIGVSSHKEILTASVPEMLVKEWCDALNEFGIKPELITLKGYAKAVWLKQNIEMEDDILFVDLGVSETTILFVVEGEPVMIRSLPPATGNRDIAEAIQRTAMGLKQRRGNDLTFDRCIVTVDGSHDNTLAPILTRAVGCRVEYASVEADYLGRLYKIKNRVFNFCQGEFKAASFFYKHFASIAVSSSLAVFVFVLAVLNIYTDIAFLEKETASFEKAQLSLYRSIFPEAAAVKDPYLQLKAGLKQADGYSQSKADTDKSLRDRGVRAVDILLEVSAAIPGKVDIEISRFVFNSNRLILSGTTDNYNNVDRVKGALEKSDIFSKVTIIKAAADKKEGGVFFRFSIDL